MEFVKYHGLGNDFIILTGAHALHEPDLDPERVRTLCERGFGIGADGVMWAAPPTSPEAALRMGLINSDGSLPEMCGNGLRCLVKYAVDRLGFRDNPLAVETNAGVLSCAWTADAAGVTSVTVAMSPPTFDATRVPVDTVHIESPPPSSGLVALKLDDRVIRGVAVNTGNPHFAIFGDSSRARALADGPRLERHLAFPLRANIEFVEVIDRHHLKVTVWERGCGLTLACGTGATAATAAAVRLGLCEAGAPVRVDLPGGPLAIAIGPDFTWASMTGPAACVYRGFIDD